jgi:CRP/FNR family transcriptional regulator, anaerobic regulatory protein
MKDSLRRLLELYPALGTVPDPELRHALAQLRYLQLRAGAVVFEELQSCAAFPFVTAGSLRVVKRSENGREISLYEVMPGDACVVSSACLLGNRPYNAVGVVQADCELAMMPAEAFNQLLSIRVFREFIFSLFSKRVIELLQLIDAVAFQKLDQRLARLLLKRAPMLETSHQQLADELGTVREMITRTLSSFAERELIRLQRGSIHIVDRSGLELVGGS